MICFLGFQTQVLAEVPRVGHRFLPFPVTPVVELLVLVIVMFAVNVLDGVDTRCITESIPDLPPLFDANHV